MGETADSPVAHGTKLGWVLSGRVPCREGNDLSVNANFVSTHVLRTGTDPIENSRVDVMVEKLWDFESVGIREKDTVHGSFINNISKEGDKYCIRLPVKENNDIFPDNYNLSGTRLKSSLKRLRKDPETLQAYEKIIRDQDRDGAREEMLGGKNCQSADGERSEQNFYGPHLSDWLKMRLHSLKA